MKRIICLTLLAALALAPSAAEAYWLDISGSYWNPEPSGTVAYSLFEIPALTTPPIDVDKDLGLEKKGVGSVRAKVDLPLLNIGLMATPIEFEKTGSLARDVSFGGYTMSAFTQVTGKVTANHYDATIFWNIPLLEEASLDILNIEFGLNARMVDFEISVGDTARKVSKAVSATIPMGYLGVQINPVDSFGIDAEYRGLSVGDNKYTDIMAMLQWRPVDLFYIGAGYRSEKLELDEEGIRSDLEFKGPYGSLGLRF